MTISRRHIAAAALLVSGASVLARTPALAETADATAVANAVAALTKAMLAADKAGLEALVADQLSYGHSGGVVQDKAAFVDVIASSIGSPAGKWIHYGLTSADVVDTAQCAILTRAADVLGGAIDRLIAMLTDLVRKAGKAKLRLAPFIGVACPGIIREDGSIQRGGQNLPGNWESSRFNLPKTLRDAVPIVDDHATVVVMHNDAVIQGLSEIPSMQDVERWGVLTIGTGLGNACFTNRRKDSGKKDRDKDDGSR